MRESLNRVLNAFESWVTPTQWVDAREVLSQQREQVERTIANSPNARIYGFTTLLGHLDSVTVDSVGQTELLRAHLIGPTTIAPAEFMQLVALCKAEQLHHGGSGIHPHTFDHVIDATTTENGSSGSWLSSYGAGDVVPAAWWVRSMIGDAASGMLTQGDLIALLNGNFYSTALATCASMSAIDVIAEFLARATVLCSFPRSAKERVRSTLSPAILGAFPTESEFDDALGQLPVSLRDAGAYVLPATTVIDAIGKSLDRRLGSASANPLFVTSAEGNLSAESQSSFLDPTVTFALTNLIQYLHFAIGAMQRMIVHLCERALAATTTPNPQFVQPPKVAQALLERARSMAGQLPLQFSGSESEGVEDLRDLSLLTAQSVLELIAIGRDVLALLDSTLAASDRSHAGPSDLFRAELIRLLVNGGQLDAQLLFARFAPLKNPFLH